MKNKKVLEKIMDIQAEDIPREGDIISYERLGVIKAKVYEVHRSILDKGEDLEVYNIYVQSLPIVSALIKKRRE